MTTGGEVQDGWSGQLPFLKPPPPAKPHHLGHRERLRERALNGGLAALPDYEALELFLYRIFPRGDVKPLAKDLLKRFGSLAGCSRRRSRTSALSAELARPRRWRSSWCTSLPNVSAWSRCTGAP